MCSVAPPPTVRTVVIQRARVSLTHRTLGVAAVLLPLGCFTGLPDGEEPEPWETNGEGGSDAGSETDAADDGVATQADAGDEVGSDGGSADPTSADGGSADPTSADGGSADPTGADASADGGSADGGGTDGGTDDGGIAEPEVPDNAFCMPVAAWAPGSSSMEEEILAIVNQRRAQGANCGSEGNFGPTGPLTMQIGLRCAARVHSKQMVEQDFFDHTTPWGETPWDRMAAAGYQYSTAGENIAAGNATAAATMDQWMASDGHCSNIMKPDFTEIGVGYFAGAGYGHYWTQAFGSP